MGREKDIRIILEFRKKLKNKVSVNKIILFGSRASGKSNKHSDFDLIIVSQSFEGIKSFKRASVFYGCWNTDYPVDFICLTSKEFNKLKSQVSIVSQAIKEGIEIK